MAFDLANTYLEVRGRLQDQDATNPHLADADLTIAVRAALERFGGDRPRELVAEFAGDGGQYYALTTALVSWRDGFSSILWIDYPAAVIASDEEPTLLDPALDWTIFPAILSSVRTLYLYFPNHSPTASETIRIAYTAPHTLDDLDAATATTIDAAFEAAFYHLAAGFAAQQLAG